MPLRPEAQLEFSPRRTGESKEGRSCAKTWRYDEAYLREVRETSVAQL